MEVNYSSCSYPVIELKCIGFLKCCIIYFLCIDFFLISNLRFLFVIFNRFYALAAAAALIKYVEFSLNMLFSPKSLRVEYQGSQTTMVIGKIIKFPISRKN